MTKPRRSYVRTRLRYQGDRHYLVAYLWRDFLSFDAGMRRRGCQPVSTTLGGVEHITLALHHPAPYRLVRRGRRWRKVAPPKLGEVHFVRGHWSMSTVVHELVHAAFHRFRACVVLNRRTADMEDEESVCYPVGVWAGQLYAWLWARNPPRTRKA